MKRLVTIVMLISVAGSATAQGMPGWLIASDYGASGSEFSTDAVTVADANQVTVKDVGDFEVGQGVMVSRCNIQYSGARLWGPRADHSASRALEGELEFRGYDGAAGSWFAYMVDVGQATPATFRWSDDLGRNWHDGGPVDDQWHMLGGGTEVRFGELDWEAGYTVTFSARDQLVSRIEAIEGNVLTLTDNANCATPPD